MTNPKCQNETTIHPQGRPGVLASPLNFCTDFFSNLVGVISLYAASCQCTAPTHGAVSVATDRVDPPP